MKLFQPAGHVFLHGGRLLDSRALRGFTDFVRANLAPGLDHGRGHFDMALQGEMPVIEQPGLVGAEGAFQQPLCAIRDGKGFAMPLEYLETRGEAAQPGGGRVVSYLGNLAPADFLDRVAADRGAQSLAHELSAQAVAQHGDAIFYGLPDEFEGRRDPGQVIIHAHRAAHQDQSGKAVDIGGQAVSGIYIGLGPENAFSRQEIAQVARTLGLGKSENHDRAHMKKIQKINKQLLHCMAWALFFLSSQAISASVGVVGLFKDKAMVSIDGGAARLISAGQAIQGVKLLSASSDAAIFEVDGKRRTLGMGQSFAAQSGNGGKPVVVLNADSRGHFATQGTINGASVTFLIDTGATNVTLHASEAARLGIKYKTGQPMGLSTANGIVPAWRVTFNSVKVGGITLHQIEGLVVESGLEVALLGMSFLNRTDMKREGQTMTLTQRY